jgi:dinuclear metal center YbgI/SA1388 family protein
MIKLKEIVSFLNEYLGHEKFLEDSSWNGLQVEGNENVKKIVFGVTAGVNLFKKAKEENADMIICHHGLFWKQANPSISGWQKDRVSFLVENKISFYASHLPLDAHPDCGNNVEILKILDAKVKDKFSYEKGENIGWIGECNPVSLNEIVQKLKKSIKANCVVLDYGKKEVKNIAVVSGGAPYDVFEAIEKEVDLFITGDAADVLEVVRDAKINVIFAGHYATETTGVKALQKIVEEKFNIETSFIDVPTNL